jgi:hypothetical protein
MKIKYIKDEVFSDYNKTSMLIAVPYCNTKCWEKYGLSSCACQNEHLNKLETIDVKNEEIIKRYLQNPITKAIVFGGRDSWDSLEEIIDFIKEFRKVSKDDCVLYTGREYNVIEKDLYRFKDFKNIYIKYGHYNPNSEPITDELTSVVLASKNQKFIRV